MTNEVEAAVIDTLTMGVTVIYRTNIADEAGRTLAGLQQAVGGYVDCMDVKHPDTGSTATLWFHDEGKIIDLTPNPAAMALAFYGGWDGLMRGDWIAGPVVVTGFDAESGETMPLPSEWMEVIAALA